jgi:nucleotide-binding universal stress UspA family protein
VIERILVALDGSPRARGVMQAAMEIAKRFDATLVPFRAIQIPPAFPPAAHMQELDALPDHMKELATVEILALLGNSDVSWELPVIEEGQAWRTILEAAEQEQVDLIVIGSHGYQLLDRMLGTTAEKVANRAQRNVLIVHELPIQRAIAAAQQN